MKFSPDGTILFTASKDKSIAGVDVTTAKLINQKHHAHKYVGDSILIYLIIHVPRS